MYDVARPWREPSMTRPRPRYFVSLIPALALCLASCGRTGQDNAGSVASRSRTEAPDEAATPARPDGRPVIVALGDSITAGFGLEPGNSYTDFLQKELDAKGHAYRVVNAGVSGDTTSGGLARLQTVIEQKPRIVILELGGNDGLRGLPLRTTRSNLEQMIRRLRGAGAQVLLAGMTLPPNYGPDYIRAFEEMYTEVAARENVRLAPLAQGGIGGFVPYLQADGIHPTQEGQRKLAAILLQALEPILVARP